MKITNPVVVRSWTVGRIILVLWLIISVYFVYEGVANRVMNEAYRRGALAGQKAAFLEVINKAEREKCKTIFLFEGDPANPTRHVDLIDMDCLQTNSAPASSAPPVSVPVPTSETEE